ncbi:MAG TPA: hypothetical protein ENJ08_10385 [Gammaproteobacteria bacterium]|nr:hypothetical protein [Gammaproteobacteria bacterium]
MITKEEMLNPVLVVSPDFSPVWNKLLNEHLSDGTLPVYVGLTELAKHISELHQNKRSDEIKEVFAIVEQWIAEGDSFVHEAATSGLLEDLQNINIVGAGISLQLKPYLLPETERWWENNLNAWLKWE